MNMKHPCCSEILFDKECTYDGMVDTEKQSYSVRNGKYYHYLCYEKSENQIIYLTSHVKKKLGNYLLNLWHTGNKEHWLESVLNACGYRPKEKNE